MLIALAASHASAQTGTLLPPNGPYGVGRIIFHWRDPLSDEVLSPWPGDKRELGAWFWYPAVKNDGKDTVPYVDQLDLLAPSLSKDEVSLARSVQTHAVANAPAATSLKPFPILIFSPGAGSLPALYTSFFEDLASYGYVVAALDHPYDDLAVPLSDGRIAVQTKQPSDGEELLRYERSRVEVRVRDVKFAIKQLYGLQDGTVASPLKGQLDVMRIGIFGHSVGGMTAAQACIREPMVRACANLDGVVNAMPLDPDADSRPLTRPFLFFEKSPLPMPGETAGDAQRRIAALRMRGNSLMTGVQRGRSYRISVDGATHATFSDEEVITDAKARSIELLDHIRIYLRAFFDEALSNERSLLLNRAPSDKAFHIEVFTPSVRTQ